MKGVRVALVVSEFPARSETFITSKAAGLAAAGWDIRIVCQKYAAALFAGLPAEQQSALRGRISTAWPHRPKWLAAMLAPAVFLRCAIRRPVTTFTYLLHGGTLRQLYLDADFICLKPDLIHFEFGAIAAGRMAIGAQLGARVIVSFRGYDLNLVGLDDPRHYAGIWEHASAIHVLGEQLWRRALERGCPPDKLHALIPPAIDTAVFVAPSRAHRVHAGASQRPLRVLSVGRLDWRKGYEYALESIRLLEDQGIRCEYHILGDGEFHTATAYARYQLALTDSVTLAGARPPAAVRAEMEWADVMLHAAVSEGFCNAVLEAQAMKLPVVCTNAGGLPENVADGTTGIIVPARSPRALADALARLASDPELRARMGEAGRERAVTHFQLKDQVAAFGSLYERVLALSLHHDGAR